METEIMENSRIEPKDFDFKKVQRELIRKELRPVLYEHGFVLSRPTTYIRERDGLLQEFYFSVQVGKLRPWVSYRPVFDSRCIVAFGTDSIPMKDSTNPYSGFGWCFFDGIYSKDASGRLKNYERQFLPRFERLKSSIVNGLLPEMDSLRSLDDFIRLYENDGMLFSSPIHVYDSPGRYFDFISGVNSARGKERMELVFSAMSKWGLQNLPKTVKEYLEEHIGRIDTDDEADKVFHEYCNKIRMAYKLDIRQ